MRTYAMGRIDFWDKFKSQKKTILKNDAPIKPIVPKKKIEVASTFENFIQYSNGIIYDKKNDIEWIIGPDKDIGWQDSVSWVSRINIDGTYNGNWRNPWRMPKGKELKTLYRKRMGDRNIIPLIKISGWMAWTGETAGSKYSYAFTYHSGEEARGKKNDIVNARVFAVRYRKK